MADQAGARLLRAVGEHVFRVLVGRESNPRHPGYAPGALPLSYRDEMTPLFSNPFAERAGPIAGGEAGTPLDGRHQSLALKIVVKLEGSRERRRWESNPRGSGWPTGLLPSRLGVRTGKGGQRAEGKGQIPDCRLGLRIPDPICALQSVICILPFAPFIERQRSIEQGRKESNPVHPGWSRRPLPGGHPCEATVPRGDTGRPGGSTRFDQASARAGSAGSARNFDQLGTRAPRAE